MADLVRMSARRPFRLTPKRRLTIGEAFEVSAGLAARLVRRGDAEAAPLAAKPRRKRKQAPE